MVQGDAAISSDVRRVHPARQVIGELLWFGGGLCTALGAGAAGACLVVAITPTEAKEGWTEFMGVLGMVLGAMLAGGGLVVGAVGQLVGDMDERRRRTTSAALGLLCGLLWALAVVVTTLTYTGDPRPRTALWSLPGLAVAVLNGLRLRRRAAPLPLTP